MLAEVLTYLNKGLSLTGCPVAGMDKHQGGMFEILGPMSKEMAADKINLTKKKKLCCSSDCRHHDKEKEGKDMHVHRHTPDF